MIGIFRRSCLLVVLLSFFFVAGCGPTSNVQPVIHKQKTPEEKAKTQTRPGQSPRESRDGRMGRSGGRNRGGGVRPSGARSNGGVGRSGGPSRSGR